MDLLMNEPGSEAPYREMYLRLFRAAAKAIELLDRGKGMEARALLIRAQQETEELYIEGE